MSRKMTVVFEVKDESLLPDLYKSHLGEGLICGCIPTIILIGDQITVPSDILDGLDSIDPDFPDRKELINLQKEIENHRRSES